MKVATPAQVVLEMPERDFRDLIDNDTRGRYRGRPLRDLDPNERAEAEALFAALRSPEVAVRWTEVLSTMFRSVESQLAAKGAEAKARAAELRAMGKSSESLGVMSDHERWRAGALRFKAGLEERLVESQRVIRELQRSNPDIADKLTDERNAALARVALLEMAIRKHRDTFPAEEEPSDSDEELWAVLQR